MSIYCLSHRRLLHLSGEAPISFLQDILTADIATLKAGEMRQSCLLSPQGRILIEMMIMVAQTGDSESLYIACDQRQMDELVKKLKLYRLRRKIDLRLCDDEILLASAEPLTSPHILLTCEDERAPQRGYISIAKKTIIEEIELSSLDEYHARRIQDGIPEGPDELIENRALMLEAGLDWLMAVDFKKGCYIGQEVTARTRYRGLVKKRLVPVVAPSLSPSSAIIYDDKEVGVILSAYPHPKGMIGFAYLRTHAIHEAVEGATITSDGTSLSIVLPPHMPPIAKPGS